MKGPWSSYYIRIALFMKTIIAVEWTLQEKVVAKLQTHIYREMVRTLKKNFNLLSGVNLYMYTNIKRKNALENVYSSVRR
jgi:hypothetical protein